MKKKKRQEKAGPAPQRKRRQSKNGIVVVIIVLIAILAGARAWKLGNSRQPASLKADEPYHPRAKGEVTFNKDIAPIVFQNCIICHRPGQSAPFALLTYADVKKRASDIANVTAKRIMPPWLPEPGHGEFQGERRLTSQQIGLIQQWASEGALEGKPHDLPVPPTFAGEWQLGQPDLIVKMPAPYTLAAEGRDVYRNFVIPVSITGTKYVRGVELRPDNPRIVHHAFVKVDRTGQSRRIDAQDAEVGFPGMTAPAEMPDGHFLGWQPGRLPKEIPSGLAWRLDAGNDLVLQTHLNPSGKPETLQASIGLFFTDQPPTNKCYKLTLASFAIDIPPGESNYIVTDSLTLPVDVQALAVLPHAHYLAKEMHGWATLPNGRNEELLLIKQWDFNWHGDYRYKEPVFLPKGTKLSMRFTYDNSTNNIRNPNHPPKLVSYGSQSLDEMGELWFQLLPRNESDLADLDRAYQANVAKNFMDAAVYRVTKYPNEAKAHEDLGALLYQKGNFDEAGQHLVRALQLDPKLPQSHYYLGLALRRKNHLAEAREAFEAALRLDPNNAKACGNLGFVCMDLGDLDAAQKYFSAALALNPDDLLARDGLNSLLKARK